MSVPPEAGAPVLRAPSRERLMAPLDGIDLLLAHAPAESIARRPASGKWSAHENLAHLGRYHEIFLERLDRMLHEDAPALGRYRADDDPELARWAALSTSEVRRRMRERRAALADAVAALTPSTLARTGVHPVFGAMSIALWVEFFLAHEGHHMYVILQRLHDPR